jgi:hypothetical protein
MLKANFKTEPIPPGEYNLEHNYGLDKMTWSYPEARYWRQGKDREEWFKR